MNGIKAQIILNSWTFGACLLSFPSDLHFELLSLPYFCWLHEFHTFALCSFPPPKLIIKIHHPPSIPLFVTALLSV